MAEEIEDKIASVVSQTQLNQENALEALDRTDGDVDRAVELIKSSEQNICIVKGRFTAPYADAEGGFLIIIDAVEKEIERMIVSVFRLRGLKFSADIKGAWSDFQEAMYSMKLDEGEIFETTQKLHTFLERDVLESNLDLIVDAGRTRNISQLNMSFADWIKEVIYDQGLSVETEVETITNDVYRRSEVQRSQNNQTQAPAKVEAAPAKRAKRITATLTAEPFIDPIGGRPVSDLNVGDMVLIRITDARDIARYITQLIGGRQGDEIIPLAAKIERIDLATSGRYTMTVKLGESLAARMIGESKMKVRMALRGRGQDEKGSSDLSTALAGKNYGLPLTVFLTASLFVMLVIIFYLLWTGVNL